MGDPPRSASLDAVAEFASGLEMAVLICRSNSHVWDWLTSSVKVVDHTLECTTDCSQCGTTRTIVYTKTGYIEGRKYNYPQGYRREGLGRIDTHGRAAMRTEMFRRMVGD